MLGIFERILDVHALAVRRLEAVLHHHAVRDDVEVPLLKSRTSFCASLMMISMIVLSIHCA